MKEDRKLWLWIYEYKDDETAIGATIYEGFADELPDEFKFPHLNSEWNWQMEKSWELKWEPKE